MIILSACPSIGEAQKIAVYFDPAAEDCDDTVQTFMQFYIVATLSGPASGGITGAEFRLDGIPSDWLIEAVPNPAADIVLGNPLTGGCSIRFPECQPGPTVLLYTLRGVPLGGGSFERNLYIRPHTSAGTPQCPWVTLCDDPWYTLVCVCGGVSILNGVCCDNECTTADPPPAPTLSVSDASVTEGGSGTHALANFAVTLFSPTPASVRVDYATQDGSATAADQDYAATSGRLVFCPGQTLLNVSVPVIGDACVESWETYSLHLSNAVGGTIADGQGEGVIQDDDPSPACGAPVVQGTGVQSSPSMIPDGAGGAIITWTDHRGGNDDIYVQRVGPTGEPQWAVDGVALCVAPSDQKGPQIVSDGAGGAIITWYDKRSGADSDDIYAQRVNASGMPQWTASGVALSVANSYQALPAIAQDGAGGAVVTWQDFRDGTNDIYAQRVNAAGVPQWTTDGVGLCIQPNHQNEPKVVSDGAGGAIITWYDKRNGVNNDDIYAQRLNAAGVPQWTANGVALSMASSYQAFPAIISDGAAGAIVVWHDFRSGNNDIYARRVNAAGVPQWGVDGVSICIQPNDQNLPQLVSDGAGGAIITWYDKRNGLANDDIFAQRVNAAGVPQWAPNGVPLSLAASYQALPAIVPDGGGGAIVAWQDFRSGDNDIYAQRVNAAGVPQWTIDGVSLCVQGSSQILPVTVTDGAGGATVAWEDDRACNTDIFTRRLGPGGAVDVSPQPDTELADEAWPNPFRHGVSIEFTLSSPTSVHMEVADIAGRQVWRTSDAVMAAGRHRFEWRGELLDGSQVPSGVYFLRLRGSGIRASRRVIYLH